MLWASEIDISVEIWMLILVFFNVCCDLNEGIHKENWEYLRKIYR